ncbi:MAG: response regulator transcription factor [Terracidiphilus sp.]|nr:response regulator transcription factor [Terracidiphilus sp.]
MVNDKDGKIQILIVDDHPVVRIGLAAIVDTQEDMTVVAEAGSGDEAIAQFRQYQPDVTIMDLRMEGMGGAECIRAIRAEFRDAKFVVLTMYRGDEDIRQAMDAGANSYLIKGMSRQALANAVRRVARGECFLPESVSETLAVRTPESELSVREREVLRLLAAGMCNKEIASSLGIAEVTVKCHLRMIFLRLGVTDRTQAIIAASQRGLVHL